jgi:hypothetical protein
MDTQIILDAVYVPSENVIARQVQGEFIIIPITSGIADLANDIFKLTETGRLIWDKLDGKRRLKDIIDYLSSEFEASVSEIEKDLLGLVEELVKRKMLTKV